MLPASEGRTRVVLTTIAVCAVFASSACKPAPQRSAEAEFQQAREQLARAADRLADEQRPITDRAALARSLKLDPKRFAVIKTGDMSPGPVVLAFDSGANCKNGKCVCVGDRDCNDMFSTICRHESTDGSCSGSGDTTACSCNYVAGETPEPVEPG